jgi:hypothetical protein
VLHQKELKNYELFIGHTKTLDVSDKHRKSKIANRKIFIFGQDNFLRLDTTSFIVKAQYEPLIEIQKNLNSEAPLLALPKV